MEWFLGDIVYWNNKYKIISFIIKAVINNLYMCIYIFPYTCIHIHTHPFVQKGEKTGKQWSTLLTRGKVNEYHNYTKREKKKELI